MSHGDILDAIDSSLRDNSVSADAMRWSPDREVAEAQEHWQPWRDLPPRTSIRQQGPAVILEEADWGAIGAGLNAFVRSFAEDMQAMGRTMSKALQPLADLAARSAHDRDARERPRWHRNRCRQCNPAGNPLPLPGGREYRRRQKARKRRAKR